MSCDRYDRYRAGESAAEDFARHALGCAECREQAALDERLDREIEALRGPIAAAGLWDRIETALAQEKRRAAEASGKPAPGRPGLLVFLARRWPLLVPAAAAVAALLIVGLAGLGRPAGPSGILAGRALARVERAEKEYAGAIEALERQARPRISAMDRDLASLYKNKLAVIDDQIGRCREALASNPGNAHIRQYLLAALRDKRQTLADALGSTDKVS